MTNASVSEIVERYRAVLGKGDFAAQSLESFLLQ